MNQDIEKVLRQVQRIMATSSLSILWMNKETVTSVPNSSKDASILVIFNFNVQAIDMTSGDSSLAIQHTFIIVSHQTY
jgi:hypothetical protein